MGERNDNSAIDPPTIRNGKVGLFFETCAFSGIFLMFVNYDSSDAQSERLWISTGCTVGIVIWRCQMFFKFFH